MKHYDVIIIGAGPGGTPAALHLAQRGKEVLLVDERGKPGGECLFEGCIPSKILGQSADSYYLSKYLPESGIETKGELSINWGKVIEKKKRILKMRSGAALNTLGKIPTLTFKSGTGKFLSNKDIEISYSTGEKERVGFDKAIIATGSRTFLPPIKGNGIQHVWTNKEFFEETELPGSIVIIGAGAIGIEFAQMFSKLGIKCTVIEMLDRIFPPVDGEFAQLLYKKMTDEDGIDIHLSSRVIEINLFDERFDILFKDKGGNNYKIDSDKVLIATGRAPNIEGLNLGCTKIKYDRAGIEVNDYLETADEGIYAVGDVINAPKFAHTATYEAHIAAENILQGDNLKADFSKNSWVLFSDPEIASAGITEEEAVKRGYKVITGKYDYRIDARAQINERPFGFLKFVVNKENLQILGVHIITEGASDIVGEASLIISIKATLRDVAEAIHPHPTLTESFGFLARNMLSAIKGSII